ncbi:adenylate/guanylate cyclase domain-containing protein [Aurantimonas sp. A2-1-M11]|uniref:adenylate/guanylate cyclase domain-containing protein n=1 Tax=Aurantimonas sp. A2-1-M11 TaxID=3113712 RepID=UPI003FA56828
MRHLSDTALSAQANNLNSMITDIRSYYARNVVRRVLANPDSGTIAVEGRAGVRRHRGQVHRRCHPRLSRLSGDQGSAGGRQACLAMAIAMQRRIGELNAEWRRRGIEKPFQARTGINTGFCNVGNFGSADRIDYTIIGAEANLATRFEQIAEPGGIVMSYETYAQMEGDVRARPLAPISLKCISRKVILYVVEGVYDNELEATPSVINNMPTVRVSSSISTG